MIRDEKLKQISTKLIRSDKTDDIATLRQNVEMYVQDPDITIRDISEQSGVPIPTINNLLYKDKQGIRLSTAIALARALQVSIDELVGCQTMTKEMRESVEICRGLPENALLLVRYFIRHQKMLYSKVSNKSNYISVFVPKYENGILATTNVSEMVNLENFPSNVKSKAYTGIKIPNDSYMPYYMENEIVLVACDREAVKGEHCIITSGGGIYIVKKETSVHNGRKENHYISLFGDSDIIPDGKIDDRIGYVVGFIDSNGKWGVR